MVLENIKIEKSFKVLKAWYDFPSELPKSVEGQNFLRI